MFLILSFVKITFWYRNAYIFYLFCFFLLVVVLLFGITASGCKRWVNLYFLNLQPSELMKIAIIVCFARYYHRIQSVDIQSYRFLLIPIILLIVPCYLVINQPDLGTSILIAGSGIVVIWIAGLNIKYFVYSGLLFLVSFPFVVSILKPYQKSRILTFFNPDRDPLGAGYQIIQSKIAIGSGGFFGKGYLKGTQSYLEFLPEKHTDFIFTLFSEEFGFLGSLLISAPFVISFLKPYQKIRILTFFNPERDPLGSGYQIIQSKIAVGSGGLYGKGFLKGTQSYLEFLPEKHTDFIFTLFSEEHGFAGSLILLVIYAIMILELF